LGPIISSAASELLRQVPGQSTGAIQIAAGSFLLPFAPMREIARAIGILLAGLGAGSLAMLWFQRRRKPNPIYAADLQRLSEERRRFQAAAEASRDGFYMLDSVRDAKGSIQDFTFRFVNAEGERRLKVAAGSLIGASAKEHFGRFYDQKQVERYFEVVETGVSATYELAVTSAGAKIKWLRHHVVQLGDGVAISSTDLTEFKAVQDRFLRVSEFNEHIFEQAPFSIIATDGKGTITAMNIEAEQLTGYSSQELIGTASILLLHDPQELQQRAIQRSEQEGVMLQGIDLISAPAQRSRLNGLTPIGDALSAKLPGSHSIPEQDWTFIRRDGMRVPVSLALKILTGPNGERTGMVGIAHDSTKRRHVETDAVIPALYDDLTGLVSQSLLEDRISQAIKRSRRAGTKVAVLTVDVDHFKRINDALGHPVGDEILTTAAQRLLSKVRISDTVARIGGDEFIVLLTDHTEISNIEFNAEQLLHAISAPYMVSGSAINVTSSIGICVYPDLAADTEHLLRRSETAMFWAKEAGRNRSAIFLPRMLEDAYSRLSMEGALRLAMDREELFIEYQPQVALPSGRVIGMEALLRWRHPRLGLVSPAHFIPMAEKLGLLSEFGMWATRRACREAKWIQEQLGRRVSLSVNLSPHQFAQPKLLRTIEESLQESGLHPNDLEIEIIENTLMANSTANLKTLQMIRDLGVGLSIDDFGTGFCNFNYLLQYQVDRLKIDQSFVRQAASDVNAASVVRTVIAMSHGLGVKVIAEGVETRDQLKFLLRRRCDQAQGYFFARPLSPEKFIESVPGIERMNLSDPSGERAAVALNKEEQIEFVRPAQAPALRSVIIN
jgi:diguanylate cyclase (GGDEF)-like protein